MGFVSCIWQEEFSRSIDTTNYDLMNGNKVPVIWKWLWVEGDTHSTTSSETETDKSSKNNDEESFNDENDIDDFPAITHSVIF